MMFFYYNYLAVAIESLRSFPFFWIEEERDSEYERGGETEGKNVAVWHCCSAILTGQLKLSQKSNQPDCFCRSEANPHQTPHTAGTA
jgi:hypothetical protein